MNQDILIVSAQNTAVDNGLANDTTHGFVQQIKRYVKLEINSSNKKMSTHLKAIEQSVAE